MSRGPPHSLPIVLRRFYGASTCPGFVQGAPRPPRGRRERGGVFGRLMVDTDLRTSNLELRTLRSQTKPPEARCRPGAGLVQARESPVLSWGFRSHHGGAGVWPKLVVGRTQCPCRVATVSRCPRRAGPGDLPWRGKDTAPHLYTHGRFGPHALSTKSKIPGSRVLPGVVVAPDRTVSHSARGWYVRPADSRVQRAAAARSTGRRCWRYSFRR